MNAIMEIHPNTAKYTGLLEAFAVLAMTVGAAVAIGALLPVNFDPAAAPVKQEQAGPAYTPEWQGSVDDSAQGAGAANTVETGSPKFASKQSKAGKARVAKGGARAHSENRKLHVGGKRVAFRFPTRRSAH